MNELKDNEDVYKRQDQASEDHFVVYSLKTMQCSHIKLELARAVVVSINGSGNLLHDARDGHGCGVPTEVLDLTKCRCGCE